MKCPHVGEELQRDGVVLFEKSYVELLATIETRRTAALKTTQGVME